MENTGEFCIPSWKTTMIVDLIYPIGSIFISTNNTNPFEAMGIGTWEKIEDRFLLASGTKHKNGSTGGEATHTLTVEEMPSHSHELNDIGVDWSAGPRSYSAQTTTTSSRVIVVNPVGGGQAHNNMPPYLAVYMWKRIA